MRMRPERRAFPITVASLIQATFFISTAVSALPDLESTSERPIRWPISHEDYSVGVEVVGVWPTDQRNATRVWLRENARLRPTKVRPPGFSPKRVLRIGKPTAGAIAPASSRPAMR